MEIEIQQPLSEKMFWFKKFLDFPMKVIDFQIKIQCLDFLFELLALCEI